MVLKTWKKPEGQNSTDVRIGTSHAQAEGWNKTHGSTVQWVMENPSEIMAGPLVREEVDPESNKVGTIAREAAFRVHRNLGPGLLESAYEACLAYEMGKMGLKFKRQVELPLTYEDVRLDVGFRIDLWVEEKVILEIKAVDMLLPIHTAQVITYLKLTGNQLGYLVNFNARFLKDGLKRIVRTG